MRIFLLNLLLALVWTALLGRVGGPQFVLGFVVGYLLLWLARPMLGPTGYFEKLPRTVMFTLYLVWQLVKSNVRVAWDVLTPKAYRKPGIVGIPLAARSDAEITLLANLITLTPGTLSLDVSDDRGTLYVHAMFVDDPDALRREIKDGFERRVLELLR